ANSIVPEFALTDSQKGLLVAVPLLGGALLRLALGLLTDQIGARRTGLLGLTLTSLPLLLGWLWADSFDKIILVGLLLGVAGASFAAALPLASRRRGRWGATSTCSRCVTSGGSVSSTPSPSGASSDWPASSTCSSSPSTD